MAMKLTRDPTFSSVKAETLTADAVTVAGVALDPSSPGFSVLDVTAGTITGDKAVVVDASKNAGDFNNLDCVNLDAGKSGTAGTVDIFPTTGSKGKLAIVCSDQDGNTAVTVTVLGMGQATAVKLPDPGVSTSYLMQMAAENDRTIVNATPAEINQACDVSARVQTITASGAVTAGVQSVELDHTTVAIAATIATAVAHPGLFVVKSITEPGGGQDHTVTITTGTWNGTNKVATFADINDTLVVYFDSAGNGTVVANVGSVALSG